MVGIDIVEVQRMEDIHKKRGEALIRRVFSKAEAAYLEEKDYSPQTLAGIFAAKEAMAKATGLGLAKMGLREVQVHHDGGGAPYGTWKDQVFDLSISHIGDLAVAVAVLRDKSPGPQIPDLLQEAFPQPSQDDHKGSRGRAGTYGGRLGMLGSAFLSTRAALRVGAGYTYHIMEPDLLPLMSLKYTEEIGISFESWEEEADFLSGLDGLAIGPGLGTDGPAMAKLEAVLGLDLPTIVDADGLSLLSRDLGPLKTRQAPTILTPHEGEMARLTGMAASDIRKDRKKLAQDLAQKTGAIVLLKGRGTVITDGTRTQVNPSGNPGMATAGSGDVLTGIITGLLAQGVPPFEAAWLGAFIHGLAGDEAARVRTQNGLVASDIIEFLPQALAHFRKRN